MTTPTEPGWYRALLPAVSPAPGRWIFTEVVEHLGMLNMLVKGSVRPLGAAEAWGGKVDPSSLGRPTPSLDRLASMLLDTACKQANQALYCNDARVALDHANAAGAALAAYYETPEGAECKARAPAGIDPDPAVAVADLCRVLGYPEDLSAWEAVDGAVARLKVYREAAAALSTGMNLPLHVDIDEAVRIALGRLGAS